MRTFQLYSRMVLIVIQLCIATLSLAQYKSDSPYAIFGDNSKMLESTITSARISYQVQIQSKNGKIYLADFDFRNGIAILKESNGTIILWDSIPQNAIAKFVTIDSHAEKYYNLNPYNYCAGNPINAVDPNGKDWYKNIETSYYTWYNGDNDIDGYTHIGGKGSVLGEFEEIINNILCGTDGLGIESIYSEGFTFDIAPNDKGGLLKSEERGWDFFDEFIHGSGPEFSVILEGHPYTQAIMNEDFVKSNQEVIKSRGTNAKYTNVARPNFYPWQASISNPMQFIGTYRYDGYTSKNPLFINNVATDSKSITSLFYHIPFLKNHRRSQKKKLSNTYQFYIWKSRK